MSDRSLKALNGPVHRMISPLHRIGIVVENKSCLPREKYNSQGKIMIYPINRPQNYLKLAGASSFALLMTLASGSMASAQTSEIIDNDDGSSEVIVTVERRAQSLQDYAGTAAAISGEELSLLGIDNFTEIDGKIPGLSIANNQGNIEVYIRGVGSSNNTELGDPAAATHLNGVYVPRPSGFGAAFFDIERVEVNIGPQGTLRGRNATAGSVDIIP